MEIEGDLRRTIKFRKVRNTNCGTCGIGYYCDGMYTCSKFPAILFYNFEQLKYICMYWEK